MYKREKINCVLVLMTLGDEVALTRFVHNVNSVRPLEMARFPMIIS